MIAARWFLVHCAVSIWLWVLGAAIVAGLW
jgi:hypothetical protein